MGMARLFYHRYFTLKPSLAGLVTLYFTKRVYSRPSIKLKWGITCKWVQAADAQLCSKTFSCLTWMRCGSCRIHLDMLLYISGFAIGMYLVYTLISLVFRCLICLFSDQPVGLYFWIQQICLFLYNVQLEYNCMGGTSSSKLYLSVNHSSISHTDKLYTITN